MGSLTGFIFGVYYCLLVLRAILPWLTPDQSSGWFKIIAWLTDPILKPIKMGLPPQKYGFDVSPFIALVILWIFEKIILRILGG